MYPTMTHRSEILNLISPRSWSAVKHEASKIGVRRHALIGEQYHDVHLQLTEVEKSYIAGIVDGEGCISPAIRRDRNRKGMIDVRLVIANTSLPLIEWLESRIGGHVKPRKRYKTHHRLCYLLVVTGKGRLLAVLETLMPYLIVKKAQAALAMQFYRSRMIRTVQNLGYSDEERRTVEAIRAMNRGPRLVEYKIVLGGVQNQ